MINYYGEDSDPFLDYDRLSSNDFPVQLYETLSTSSLWPVKTSRLGILFLVDPGWAIRVRINSLHTVL